MALIIDTHAHYTSSAFDDDRDTLLSDLPNRQVGAVITAGTTIADSRQAVELAHRWEHVYAAVGVHPTELVDVTPENFDSLNQWYDDPKVVAIGELGLDYHYEDGYPPETQQLWLRRQLELANERHAPVIFHDRDAHRDSLEILQQYRPQGVVHCFSGSVEMARAVLDCGMYIGLGGAVTFKNARRPLEVAAMVPDDRLLLETDCPYMAPVPFRGHRNDSSLIVYVAEVLASLRHTTPEALIEQCAQNARRLFPKLTQPV